MKIDLPVTPSAGARGAAALAFCLLPLAALAGELHALVRDKSGTALADAVVLAVPAQRPASLPRGATATIIVDQVNKEFIPYVLPVQAGTTVNFPNKDNIRHHVYSFSPAKTFELPLYKGDSAPPVLFDKPGPVILGCNIHDWMIAYIYVTESPYYAKTGADGKARLAALPAGDYTLRVWHPRMQGKEEASERKVSIGATGTLEALWSIGLVPDFRIRRAPIPGQGRY